MPLWKWYESAGRGTCYPGRDHPGMVGDIISERWAELSRNGWAASFRNHGRLAPESAFFGNGACFCHGGMVWAERFFWLKSDRGQSQSHDGHLSANRQG